MNDPNRRLLRWAFGISFMHLVTRLLLATATLACASSAFADDPTVTFQTRESIYGDFPSYTQSSTQSDILPRGDFATPDVFVGVTTVGSGNKYDSLSAPNASASSYAKGIYSGNADAWVTWEIQGTLGPIPTVASGIPVLLNGEAYLDYESDTVSIPSTNTPATGSFATAEAFINLSGIGTSVLVCGGGRYMSIEQQSCGLTEISDDFRLIPSTTTPGLYTGFVQIHAGAYVSRALDPLAYGSPTDDNVKRADASIDPTVTIDAAFYALYPNAKLTFSPDVGNDDNPYGLPIASPAPEPAFWAMMILGVGLTGAGLRRRREAQGGLARA